MLAKKFEKRNLNLLSFLRLMCSLPLRAKRHSWPKSLEKYLISPNQLHSYLSHYLTPCYIFNKNLNILNYSIVTDKTPTQIARIVRKPITNHNIERNSFIHLFEEFLQVNFVVNLIQKINFSEDFLHF